MNNNLFIYLDESGDLGFNFLNKGTPRYFIITLLVCYSENAVKQFKIAISRTHKKLKKKKDNLKELKGSNTNLSIKKYFYRHAIKSNDWHLYGIILDKHKLKSKIEQLPKEHRIYNYLSKEVLDKVDLKRVKSKVSLIVDKRKGARGINEFNKYLSSHLEATLPLIVKYNISHEDSDKNYILQAVDIFCWGVRRYYEKQGNEWFSLYKEKLTLVEVNDFTGIKKDGP